MEVGNVVVDEPENEDICVLNVEEASEVKTVEASVEKQLQDNNSLDNDVTTSHPVATVVPEAIVPDVTRFSFDVQHGYRIFCELLSDQYKAVTKPFREPVDVEALGLWDYYTRIETPMSFRQIDMKFKNYLYQSITEIVSDLRLILENCYRYNGSNHWISKLAQRLENILDQKLALLSRSLRDKVSLQATMAFRNNKSVVANDDEELAGGRRRRSGRSNYANGPSSDRTSRLVNHMILEEEEAQKELRKQKERERKEANEALLHELAEWENNTFSPDIVNELKTMWEIPSIGSFLWLFQEALNLQELNYTEFEFGLVFPNKSQQMAWIFTVLLVTPNQRKSVHKKPPMKFRAWQKRLKEKMDLWYITREAEEFELVAHQLGPDNEFFEILGDTNPLEKKSYLDLTLHQRVLILKALCDECVDYEPQLRDYLGNADTTPFREVVLGSDGAGYSYVYFPIFDATDLRIYKQAALPSSAEWYKKWKTSKTSGHVRQGRINQSKSRKSESRKSSTSKSLVPSSTSIKEGFELVCFDIDTLRELCEKFADQTTTPSGKKRRGRPPRKQSEKVLHEQLVTLLEELSVSDARYSKARIKGMLNLMKEWKTMEEEGDSENESIAQSENQEQDEDITPDEGCANAQVVIIEAEVARDSPVSQGRIDDDMVSTSIEVDTSEEMSSYGDGSNSSLYMVTRSKHRPTRRVFYDHYISTPSPPSMKTPDYSVSRNSTISENTVMSKVSEKSDSRNDDMTPGGPRPDYSKNRVDEISKNSISGNFVSNVGNSTNVVAMETSDKTHDIISDEPQPELPPKTIPNSEKLVKETDPVCTAELNSEGLSVEKNTASIKDTVGSDTLGKSANTKDVGGSKDTDGYVRIKMDIDCNTDHVDKVVVDQGSNGNTPRNIMDTRDNAVVEDTVVRENGKCKQLSVCNGDYEPANKHHCSADSRQAADHTASLDTNQQSPPIRTLNDAVENNASTVDEHPKITDNASLETSHQFPIMKTCENVQNHVVSPAPKLVTDRVSLESSHQSTVKT